MTKKKATPRTASKTFGGKPPLRVGHPYRETGRSNYVFISCEYTPALTGPELKIFEDAVAQLYHDMVPHAGNKDVEFRHPWVRVFP